MPTRTEEPAGRPKRKQENITTHNHSSHSRGPLPPKPDPSAVNAMAPKKPMPATTRGRVHQRPTTSPTRNGITPSSNQVTLCSPREKALATSLPPEGEAIKPGSRLAPHLSVIASPDAHYPITGEDSPSSPCHNPSASLTFAASLAAILGRTSRIYPTRSSLRVAAGRRCLRLLEGDRPPTQPIDARLVRSTVPDGWKLVGPGRLELPTNGLKVHCSSN